MQNTPDTQEQWSTIESNFYSFLAASETIDPEAQHQIFALYADLFTAGQEVLDVGTGRGDFLDDLRERGVQGFGLDSDKGMIAEAQRRGHTIFDSDAITFLQTTGRHFDGVFMANFVEHFPAERVVALLQGAYRVLRPHGQLVIATPDPRSLHVHLNEFWRDATHVRLYDRHLLAFMADLCGFDVRRVESNPATAYNPGSEWFGERFVQVLRDHRPEPTRPVAAPTPRSMPERAEKPSSSHATGDDVRAEARPPVIAPHATGDDVRAEARPPVIAPHATGDDVRAEARPPVIAPHTGEQVGEQLSDTTMPWVRDAMADIQHAMNGIQRAFDDLYRDRERDAAQVSAQFADVHHAIADSQRAFDDLYRDRERDAARVSAQFADVHRALDASTLRLAHESHASGMMAEVTVQRMEDFLGHLYPPREYYLVGAKRSADDHTSGPPTLSGG